MMYVRLWALHEPSFDLQGQHWSLPQCCDLQGAWLPMRLMREVPSLSVTLTLPNLLLLTCSSIFWSSFRSCEPFVKGTKSIVSGGGSSFWLLVPWPCFDFEWHTPCLIHKPQTMGAGELVECWLPDKASGESQNSLTCGAIWSKGGKT